MVALDRGEKPPARGLLFSSIPVILLKADTGTSGAALVGPEDTVVLNAGLLFADMGGSGRGFMLEAAIDMALFERFTLVSVMSFIQMSLDSERFSSSYIRDACPRAADVTVNDRWTVILPSTYAGSCSEEAGFLRMEEDQISWTQ